MPAPSAAVSTRRGTCPVVSVAPMMDRTDRHFRAFLRRITRRVLLYTEMIPSAAVLHGDRDRLLGFDPDERPLALQLGGDDPQELALCARIAAERGFDEVNLNVGCPSERVQKGSFGVALMAQPEKVAEAVAAMRKATELPVTVKHRIGFDDRDDYQHMRHFVEIVARAGCDRFTVHCRKAWLRGLSPKENREVPPLRPGEVHRLKADLPHLEVELNGGIRDLDQVAEHLRSVDAVMIGRAAYEDPYLLATADQRFFADSSPPPSRRQVAESLLPYLDRWLGRGAPLPSLTRHWLGLFAGRPGARNWRRTLSVGARAPGAGAEILHEALRQVPVEVADEVPAPLRSALSTPQLSPR